MRKLLSLLCILFVTTCVAAAIAETDLFHAGHTVNIWVKINSNGTTYSFGKDPCSLEQITAATRRLASIDSDVGIRLFISGNAITEESLQPLRQAIHAGGTTNIVEENVSLFDYEGGSEFICGGCICDEPNPSKFPNYGWGLLIARRLQRLKSGSPDALLITIVITIITLGAGAAIFRHLRHRVPNKNRDGSS